MYKNRSIYKYTRYTYIYIDKNILTKIPYNLSRLSRRKKDIKLYTLACI